MLRQLINASQPLSSYNKALGSSCPSSTHFTTPVTSSPSLNDIGMEYSIFRYPCLPAWETGWAQNQDLLRLFFICVTLSPMHHGYGDLNTPDIITKTCDGIFCLFFKWKEQPLRSVFYIQLNFTMMIQNICLEKRLLLVF